MPERETTESLLRRAMDTLSEPRLSERFEQRLAKRTGPRRFSQKFRYFLSGYSLFGLTVSFVAMYASGMDWRLALLILVAPLGLIVAIIRPFFRSRAERQISKARQRF